MKKNKNILGNELSKLIKITLSGLMVLTCAHFSNVSAEDTEVTEEVTVETTPTSEETTEVVEEYVEETPVETEEPTIEATPEVVEETTPTPEVTQVEPTEQTVIPTEETEITGTTEITVDTDEAYEVVVPETKDETVETEVNEELKLDEMTSDELFAYIMSITSDELEALYDKYPNLDDLMANFTEEQQAQLSEKFGNAEENIEVADPRGGQGGQPEQRGSKKSATFTPNISNADVVYFFWHNANDTRNVTLNSLTSAGLTIDDFASKDYQNGYIVFFVKPDANYLINGMGASGNDDIYPIGTNDFGNISRYPGLANVVEVAKNAGYVACFGYSRSYSSQESNINANITIQGQQPSVAVSATANKTTDVKPGDVITFTVTITPEILIKTSVSNVTVTSAKINGTDVTIENLAGNTDGTYTGTVTYTVSEADCASGKVTLAVETATKYNASVTSTGQGAAISTEVTIPGSASTECSIATKNQVQYVFVSATEGKTLPSEVTKYTPSDSNTYYKGAIVNAQTPEKTTVEVNEGTWTFNDWDASSKTMTDEGIKFTGSWSFTEKKGTAGYYLALSTATWNTPTGITAYQDGDKTKYYYDKKFAKDDTFTVVSEVPTATGYEFIGWLDKERKTEGKKYAATIRQAGNAVTYIFKDAQTYTLDALWASISVIGYEGTYDGEAHTISSADIAINEGTQLDEKYVKQAKALITEGTLMYSTDNKNWSDTKPTFTNAGTYTVYVKEVVTLGGEEKTLVGQGTVQINPREITITAGSASKTYDGTELTENSYEITSGSLVGSDEITSVTITGSIKDAGTENNIASDAVIDTGSKDNYTVTYAPGTLEITRKVVAVTADNKSKTYGATDPELTATVTGTIGTDTVIYTLSRAEGEAVGTYTITASGDETQGNYKVTYETGTLTINPVEGMQVGTLSNVVYNGQEQKQAPTVTDANGNTLVENRDYELTYSEDLTNVGTVTVTVKGKGNYTGTETRTYQITPATVKVTADNKSKTYGEADPTFTATATGLIGEDTVSYTFSREEGESVGEYVITVTGNETQGNYKVTYETGKLAINPVEGMQVGTLSNVVYNGQEQKQAPTVTDAKGNTLVENTDYELTYSDDVTNVGTVTVTVKGKGNYTGTETRTYDITPVTVKVTAEPKSKTYGDADPTFTAKVEGTIGKDTVTYTLSRDEGEDVIDNGYTISPKGETTQGNYLVEYVSSTLTITPRTYTVTTNSATKVYDGTALTAVGTVNGLVDGETVVFTVTGNQTEVGSSSNTYTLAWKGTAKESNYSHGTDSIGTLTITKKEEKKDDDPTPTPTPTPSVNPGCPAGTMWNEDAKTCQTIVVPVTPTVNPTPTNTPEATATPSATPEATASAEPEKSAEPTASAETIVDPDVTPEVVTKGHWALINLIAAVVSVLLGIVLVLSKNKKDKDEDEEEQENEDKEEVKRYKRWKVVSVVDAILAVLVFIFTENMRLPMVLVDKWTMLMVLFAVVSVISLVLGRKYHEDEDEDEEKVQA